MMSQEKPVEISADYTNINTSRKQAEVSGGVWSGNLIFQYKYNPAFHSRSRSILENLNPAQDSETEVERLLSVQITE